MRDPARRGRLIAGGVMLLAIVGARSVLQWILDALGVSDVLAAALIFVGLVVLVAGVGFLATIATREDPETASLRRIRARLTPHKCPTCGAGHGGVGW